MRALIIKLYVTGCLRPEIELSHLPFNSFFRIILV
ncbi:hypothetical protein VPHD249_0068 [Vibrio phage D249]